MAVNESMDQLDFVPVGASPEQILRATPAPDDAGAETADRYEWQAMMATADILSAYFKMLNAERAIEDCSVTLICEHHEDWAVLVDGEVEIVSAKHREVSVAPFSTYKQLLGEGGVSHLFQRWAALRQTPKCRLVTSGGLKDVAATVKEVCAALRSDPDSQDAECEAVISDIADEIQSLSSTKEHTPPRHSQETIRAFLIALRIHDGEPRRQHLPDMAAERFGKRVAELFDRPDAGEAVWQAILDLVRLRMQAAGPSVGGALPDVVGEGHDEPLARRSLSLSEVHLAVRIAIRHAASYAALPRLVMANKMAIKMFRGGCSPNAIERAEALRLQYGQYWRALRGNPNAAERRARLTNALHRIVDEATRRVQRDDSEWGDDLWSELGRRFDGLEGKPEAHGLNADLLLGGVSDLANRCRAWYSESFDAAGELRRLVGEEVPL
jgi:hypothetical protein